MADRQGHVRHFLAHVDRRFWPRRLHVRAWVDLALLAGAMLSGIAFAVAAAGWV